MSLVIFSALIYIYIVGKYTLEIKVNLNLNLVNTDSEGLMPKKMEEIAFQSSDKIYGKDDMGPYECLRWGIFTFYSLGSSLEAMSPLFNDRTRNQPSMKLKVESAL